MLKALIRPATGNVTSHAKMMDRNKDQSTFFFSSPLSTVVVVVVSSPKIHPTKTTLPTIQCVLDIGIPNLLANNTVIAAELSTVKPLGIKAERKNSHFYSK